MALSAADRSIVERFTGPVTDAEESSVEARIVRLGSAYVAALEILMITRGQMRRAATNVGSGDDRVDHSRNLAALDDAIAELVASILGDDTIPLSAVGGALVAEASGVRLNQGGVLDVGARNPRRG